MARRESTLREDRRIAHDRTQRILNGVVKRLNRVSRKRASNAVKTAYKDAAHQVEKLL